MKRTKPEDTTRAHAHLHMPQHKNGHKHTISVDGCVGGCLFFQLLVCLLGLPRAMLPSCLFVWCGVPLLFCFMCLCVLWSVVCPSQFLVSWCDFWYVACAFCISMLVLFVD